MNIQKNTYYIINNKNGKKPLLKINIYIYKIKDNNESNQATKNRPYTFLL